MMEIILVYYNCSRLLKNALFREIDFETKCYDVISNILNNIAVFIFFQLLKIDYILI